MKACKAVLACLLVVFLVKLGAQAIIVASTASVVIAFGPRRLRRLPREVREDGAGHLLAVLASGVMALVLAAIAAIAGYPEQVEMASLGSWLFVGAMLLVLAFHLTSLEVEPRPARRRVVFHGIESDTSYLRKAS